MHPEDPYSSMILDQGSSKRIARGETFALKKRDEKAGIGN